MARFEHATPLAFSGEAEPGHIPFSRAKQSRLLLPRESEVSPLPSQMVATDLRQSQAISPKRSVDRRQRAVSLLKRVVAGVLVAIGHWPALLPVKENKSKSKDSSRMDEHEAKAREQWEAEAKNAAESARSLRRSRLSSPSNVRAEEENKSGVEFKSSKVAEHEAKAREQWQREARIAADAARIMRRYGGYVSATAPAPELKKEANKEAKKEVRKETKKEAKKEIKHSKGVGHETKAKAQWEAEAKKVAESTRAKRYREVASVPELKEARREVRKRSGANHEAVAQEQWEADAKNAAESARAFRLRETQVLKEEDQGWKLKGAEYQAKAMSQWESVTRTAAKVAKAEREKKEEEERKGREREEEQAKADLAREEAKRCGPARDFLPTLRMQG